MLRAFWAPAILIAMSLVAFALNKDIASLLSGVDQVTNYPAYATANLVNLANQAVQITFAVACMGIKVWKPLAVARDTLFHTAILLTSMAILASVYVTFIDNGDMYPHVNEERLLVNGATYLLIFIVAGTSRQEAAR